MQNIIFFQDNVGTILFSNKFLFCAEAFCFILFFKKEDPMQMTKWSTNYCNHVTILWWKHTRQATIYTKKQLRKKKINSPNSLARAKSMVLLLLLFLNVKNTTHFTSLLTQDDDVMGLVSALQLIWSTHVLLSYALSITILLIHACMTGNHLPVLMNNIN